MSTDLEPDLDEVLAAAEALRRDGRLDEARDRLEAAAAAFEAPPASLCLPLARLAARTGDAASAGRWALAATVGSEDLGTWQAASKVLARIDVAALPQIRRSARIALAGSHTTSVLTDLLPVAGATLGVALSVQEGDYGQYRQELLDPGSALHRSEPDVVLIAAHADELRLPEVSDSPAEDVAAEVERWTSLWDAVAANAGAEVIQHTFVVPPERSLGHLTLRTAGSRASMIGALNTRLGEVAEERGVHLVDCEHLAGLIGKRTWFDRRYWHLAKHAVSPAAIPLLARHTAAVVAASQGLTRKCLVLDLDDTLWGGVIGEDGLAGIQLGDGVTGEAFVTFQEHVLELQRRGVLLAVVSKNNPEDAREPFERHPDMRLRLDDIAVFAASWEPKPQLVRQVADELGIGLDSLVFVDDNPVEREAMRRFCPEVATVTMPVDPSLWVAALADTLLFEPAAVTADDRQRAEQYRARARMLDAKTSSDSLDDFLADLQMVATVEEVNDLNLPRVAQLLGKTNQFNLTTRRHGQPQLRALMADERSVHLTFRLKDRFTDHGLVGLAIGTAAPDDDAVLEVDTLLMSCRVLGRTLEATMLKELSTRAQAVGYQALRGRYLPTAKNGQVADLYPRLGFERDGEEAGDGSTWRYTFGPSGALSAPHVHIEPPGAQP